MSEEWEFVVRAILIGGGATLVMDLWALFQKSLFRVPSLDYAMVGRWIGYFWDGRFAHDKILDAAPVRGELFIGWIAHYVIGVLFAGVLLSIWGLEWAYHPTLFPAFIIGIATVVAPFFIMQPGMGAGIAASKTPNPPIARLRSLIAHTSFGVGLYVSALLATLVIQPFH